MKKHSHKRLIRKNDDLKIYKGHVIQTDNYLGLTTVAIDRPGNPQMFKIVAKHTTLPRGLSFNDLSVGAGVTFRHNGFGCVAQVLKKAEHIRVSSRISRAQACQKYGYNLRLRAHFSFKSTANDLAYRKITRWPNWSPPPRVNKHKPLPKPRHAVIDLRNSL